MTSQEKLNSTSPYHHYQKEEEQRYYCLQSPTFIYLLFGRSLRKAWGRKKKMNFGKDLTNEGSIWSVKMPNYSTKNSTMGLVLWKGTLILTLFRIINLMNVSISSISEILIVRKFPIFLIWRSYFTPNCWSKRIPLPYSHCLRELWSLWMRRNWEKFWESMPQDLRFLVIPSPPFAGVRLKPWPWFLE